MKKDSAIKLNRRDFIGGITALAAGGCTTSAPRNPASKDGKLKFAGIGVGGMGGATCGGLIAAGAELVAICDVDTKMFAQWEKKYPGIPKFTDYREMLEKCGHLFDAVEVGTPDHTHAYAAVDCMNAGKHAYVQKPLARTFAECETLAATARKNRVVTQMGNQGHPGVWRYAALRDAKAWGEIKELHSWSDRPIWPQGMKEFPKAEKLPATISEKAWDCWCGPSAFHPFSTAFHTFKWRGWWDYGCGAIGDMAVHNADPAFWAFELGLPYKIKGDLCGCDPITVAYPKKSRIEMWFAPNKWVPNGVKLTWYDGGLKPDLAKIPGVNPGATLGGNGLIVVGSKATTLGASHAAPPACIGGGKEWDDAARATKKEVERIVKESNAKAGYNHYKEFVDACLAGDVEKCGSRFDYAATLTEALLLGCVSLRFPGEELRFDRTAKKFTNKSAANKYLEAPKRGEWDFDGLNRPWWKFF